MAANGDVNNIEVPSREWCWPPGPPRSFVVSIGQIDRQR